MTKISSQLWSLAPRGFVKRYPVLAFAYDILLAAVFTGLAFLLRWVLGLIGPTVLVFAVCYPMLLLATLFAGMRAGIFALIFSSLAFWYAFVPIYYSFEIVSVVDGTNVLLYAAAGLAVIWISEQYRRTREGLEIEKARNELLIREMQHRSKNGLAVVSSIVTQSLKDDPEKAKKITGRLMALRAGEDLMWSENKSPIALRSLLERQLASHDSARLTLDGPDAAVSGELARTLCLVVNELATNAVKYGAWSTPTGHVTLAWGDGALPTYLRWSEEGGPTVPASGGQTGFGTFLIRRLLTQHGGALQTAFKPSGLVCTATFKNNPSPQ